MSLVASIDSFAARVALEFNAVRSEMGGAAVILNVDGGAPDTDFGAQSLALDGGVP